MDRLHIAVDYGGGSGRVLAGHFTPDGDLRMSEIHRFGNRQIRLGRHLYWDFPALFEEMITGLRKAAALPDSRIASVAIDTWGVDFGLIDSSGSLLANPICYRDEATAPYPERLAALRGGADRHYSEAGIQVMAINSVYRLMSMAELQPGLIAAADRLLFMPDLFSYFLTGEPNVEYTIASTSELLMAADRTWNRPLIAALGLPERLFGPIVMPGSVRGHLTEAVRERIGVDYDIPVIAVGSHDTASAVYASEANSAADPSTAFLSSGTWSLLGCVVPAPVLTEKARLGGFTNEGAADGRITLLQNITGLWILQRLMAEWSAEGDPISYDTLVDEAERSDYNATIDVDDPAFANPPVMSRAISAWLRERSIAPPVGYGAIGRCVMLSLADRYRRGLEALAGVTGVEVRRLNIIGGGSRNRLLNRLTAEAAGVEVIAGPVEATGIGSMLLQAEATGMTDIRPRLREIIFTK